VVAAIKASGGDAEFVRADLESPDDVRALGERAADVDVLVNNAGVFPAGATHELSEAAFDETFAVNVKAPFLPTAAIAPKMVARGGQPSTAQRAFDVHGSIHLPQAFCVRSDRRLYLDITRRMRSVSAER
jgi:NAD(P)-dependent dehydrogenase (short-subunit alcohol dehydrogenase family)